MVDALEITKNGKCAHPAEWSNSPPTAMLLYPYTLALCTGLRVNGYRDAEATIGNGQVQSYSSRG